MSVTSHVVIVALLDMPYPLKDKCAWHLPLPFFWHLPEPLF